MKRNLLFSILLTAISNQVLANGFDQNYEAYVGDLNNDGSPDIYIRQKPKILIISGDINTPLVLSPEIEPFAVLSNSNSTFTVDASPGNVELAQLEKANLTLRLGDFNLDGLVDIQLQGLALDLPGALDQIIYASSANAVTTGTAKAIDSQFQSFFGEVNAWMEDYFYYENTALQNGWYEVIEGATYSAWWNAAYLQAWGFSLNSNGQLLVEETDDPYDSAEAPNGCFWVPCRFQNGQWQLYVTAQELELEIDYSNFNQDAVQYREVMGPAMDQGVIVAGTQEAQVIEDILEGVLGTSVMGDVLTSVGAVLGIESNIPSGSLGEYRLGSLIGGTGYCEAPLPAGVLGFTASGPACAAGVILEPTPISEAVCICYAVYRIYKLGRAIFDVSEAANDDDFSEGDDCDQVYLELTEHRDAVNELFIAGSIDLAKYNELIAAHNDAVRAFEEVCYEAPELYL